MDTLYLPTHPQNKQEYRLQSEWFRFNLNGQRTCFRGSKYCARVFQQLRWIFHNHKSLLFSKSFCQYSFPLFTTKLSMKKSSTVSWTNKGAYPPTHKQCSFIKSHPYKPTSPYGRSNVYIYVSGHQVEKLGPRVSKHFLVTKVLPLLNESLPETICIS